jgi:hypothetical protein
MLTMALQLASKVELEEHDMHLPGCHAGGADQLVDIDRAWTKRRYDQLAFVLANIGQGLRRPMLGGGGKLDRRRGRGPAEDRLQRLQNVADRGDKIIGTRRASGLPGTANTSRPCSPAKQAAISDPERSAASITTTPIEIPEISRLRRGKSLPRGKKPGDRSLISRPRSPMASCNASFSGG